MLKVIEHVRVAIEQLESNAVNVNTRLNCTHVKLYVPQEIIWESPCARKITICSRTTASSINYILMLKNIDQCVTDGITSMPIRCSTRHSPVAGY